ATVGRPVGQLRLVPVERPADGPQLGSLLEVPEVDQGKAATRQQLARGVGPNAIPCRRAGANGFRWWGPFGLRHGAELHVPAASDGDLLAPVAPTEFAPDGEIELEHGARLLEVGFPHADRVVLAQVSQALSDRAPRQGPCRVGWREAVEHRPGLPAVVP